MTSSGGKLYSESTLDLTDGEFDSQTSGSFTLRNSAGFPGSAYIAFFPNDGMKLHFTLRTLDGIVYETTCTEEISISEGCLLSPAPLICSPLAPAQVGDYFYNDATWSAEPDANKTCVGIVYALENTSGEIDFSPTSSPRGRVVALTDFESTLTWMPTASDVEDLENQTLLKDTLKAGCPPYYQAGEATSFYPTDSIASLPGALADAATDQIASWYTTGVLADFDGETYTSYINSSTVTYPAGTYATKHGANLNGWYLPSAGELALLWILQQSGIINSYQQEGFEDHKGYGGYWSSSEYDESEAWTVNFISGIIYTAHKPSEYNIRSVLRF